MRKASPPCLNKRRAHHPQGDQGPRPALPPAYPPPPARRRATVRAAVRRTGAAKANVLSGGQGGRVRIRCIVPIVSNGGGGAGTEVCSGPGGVGTLGGGARRTHFWGLILGPKKIFRGKDNYLLSLSKYREKMGKDRGARILSKYG